MTRPRKHRRALFLDIDGVLNCAQYLSSLSKRTHILTPDNYDPSEMIDPVRVERLNRIVEGLDVTVVLSSSWRLGYKLATVRAYLRGKGYTGGLQSKTHHLSGYERCHEIRHWLADRAVGNFAILDDDEDAGVGFCDHYVRVVEGLEEEHVAQARRMLE